MSLFTIESIQDRNNILKVLTKNYAFGMFFWINAALSRKFSIPAKCDVLNFNYHIVNDLMKLRLYYDECSDKHYSICHRKKNLRSGDETTTNKADEDIDYDCFDCSEL